MATTHASYLAALREATAEKLESIVAAEVLKLSFIRQMKMDRLAAFAKTLIVAVILFTALMFVAWKATAGVAPQPNRDCSQRDPRDVYIYNPPSLPAKVRSGRGSRDAQENTAPAKR